MKKLTLLCILLLSILLPACNATISDSAMQTAVSQVILTSSSAESSDIVEGQTVQEPAGPSQAEFDALNTQLGNAQIVMTEQAAGISDLQSELEQVYLLLTPTITTTPQNTPTPADTATATPRPTATEFTLPYYQKYVIAKENAALYYFKRENDSGYPIMLKTEPVQRFAKGEVFIVDINRIRADGGGYYYLVIGPKNAGYYVRFEDVEVYEE